MTPSQIGERAEAAAVAALVHAAKAVYLPIGSSGRTDLIFEDQHGLHRVQVKNGVLGDRVVSFPTCSNTGNVPRDYRGDIDHFAVYCHELGSVFLLPVDGLPPRVGHLRIGAPRNNQSKKIRWADQYRLDWSPPTLVTDATVDAPPRIPPAPR